MIIEFDIESAREGSYFTIPFEMPPAVAMLTLSYHYERYQENGSSIESGVFAARTEVNIVDLGLIAPDGSQVGASGSDKRSIFVSATRATPGYRPHLLTPGEWRILVGAYKVAPAGVRVTYELIFSGQALRLLKGDFHTHTLASDGVLTTAELGWHAVRHGLDFLAVTDHNQMISADAMPEIPDFTWIPGVEWTHYQGHANFLGVDRPYDAAFMANLPEEVLARFEMARSRGALITLNHPFDEGCGFQFEMRALPFDCLEVWNGPMRASNLRAVALWQGLLERGQKVPISGGSDYHRDGLFQFLGGPTTCVFASSPAAQDILAALKAGHAYITFAPNGPTLELTAGSGMLGDTVAWPQTQEVQIVTGGLLKGDLVRVITGWHSETILEAPSAGEARLTYAMRAPGFARVEVLRAFLPGLPLLPALISNPIYFEG